MFSYEFAAPTDVASPHVPIDISNEPISTWQLAYGGLRARGLALVLPRWTPDGFVPTSAKNVQQELWTMTVKDARF
jgi:hypothetical protein